MVTALAGRADRLVYLGTPEIAVGPLRALVGAGFDVRLVVSRPDARRGRGSATAASPVKAAALDLGLPVTDRVDDVFDVGAELGVVVAFGRIIKPPVLAVLPMVNMHFSLLPRWRGAAPVERALLAGDERTGVCIMAVEEALDTGAVYARRVIDIGPDDTAQALRNHLSAIGAALLVDTLAGGLSAPEAQEGEVTYAEKIDPAELEIDWSRPAVEIHRLVRVGGAWTTFRGRRLKIWVTTLEPAEGGFVVAAGDKPLEVVEVQPEGGRRVTAQAWVNGVGPDAQRHLGT